MIQRIQSLLLFLSAVLMSVCLFSPVWKAASGVDIYMDTYKVSITDQAIITEKSVVYIAILIAASIVLSLFVISRYKNRLLQIRLNMMNTLLICIIEGLYFWNIKDAKMLLGTGYVESWGAAFYLPLGALMLCIFAGRRIQRDEELVKSVDRIR